MHFCLLYLYSIWNVNTPIECVGLGLHITYNLPIDTKTTLSLQDKKFLKWNSL